MQSTNGIKVDPWLMAQGSLKYFTKVFLGLEWTANYEEWEKLITKNKRVLVQSPRGSRKSFFFSLAYPLWRIMRGKTEILAVSDSEDQARKSLRLMRESVESNEKLKPLWPSTKELWGTDQMQFSNGSFISIMGFGTSKRGIHPDVIINDDIESEKNKMDREMKNRMFFAVICGMAMPHTQMVVVGTPLDFDDLLQQIESLKDGDGKDFYCQWKRPAELSGVNQFKDLWSDDWLAQRRIEMGSVNYAREMLLQRIDPTTQPFKREYETLYTEAPERNRYMRVVTICDPAYTEGDGDATAIVTVGITHGNHAYVLSEKAIRREDPGRIVDELYKDIHAWEPDAVGIKRRKGDAISFTFNERRIRENQWNFKYVEIKDTKSKSDVSRIGGLVPRWEARTIHLHKNMTQFLQEIYQFRLDDSHAHDDRIDALADCFHPDMATPNSGKHFVFNEETSKVGKSFWSIGNKYSGNIDRQGRAILGLVA